jgi:hypothetical protein
MIKEMREAELESCFPTYAILRKELNLNALQGALRCNSEEAIIGVVKVLDDLPS